MALDTLYPNGQVEAVLVYIWDVDSQQPVVWDGQVTIGPITIGEVDQGDSNDGSSPWYVRFAVAQAVTGPLTDTQLRATAVPVSGTVTAVQPTGTNLHVVVDSGTISPGIPVASAETISNVASSASNVTLLSANAARKGAIFFNNSTQACYVKFGVTATTITSFTYKVFPSQTLELPLPMYLGQIDAIWASANGSMQITETT